MEVNSAPEIQRLGPYLLRVSSDGIVEVAVLADPARLWEPLPFVSAEPSDSVGPQTIAPARP